MNIIKRIIIIVLFACTYRCDTKIEDNNTKQEIEEDIEFIINNIIFYNYYYILYASEMEDDPLLNDSTFFDYYILNDSTLRYKHNSYEQCLEKAKKDYKDILPWTWKRKIGNTEFIYCGYWVNIKCGRDGMQSHENEPVYLVKHHGDDNIKRYFYYVPKELELHTDTISKKIFLKPERVSALESLLNNLPDLRNFSFQNSTQIELVKKAYVYTQILQHRYLAFSSGRYYFQSYLPHHFLNMRNIREIKSTEDLDTFIELLEDTNIPPTPHVREDDFVKELSYASKEMPEFDSFKNYKAFIDTFGDSLDAYRIKHYEGYEEVIKERERKRKNYYKKIKIFLKKQLNDINKGVQRDDVFYFYTLPDLDLFMLRIYLTPDGRIFLRHHFVNEQYGR